MQTLDTKLDRYLDLLLFWNRRINLTSVREPATIREKHFADSLAVLPYIPATATSLVDVGSGAGFPGAVIAAARPDLPVTLVESNHKKAAFLEALRRELPLANLTVRAERYEQVAARSPHAFDVAVSRATWDLLEWLEYGKALIKPGGYVLGMEGSTPHELPAGAERHPYELGGQTWAIVVFHVEQFHVEH